MVAFVYRILVVDDEPDLCYVLRRILESAGHRVIDAVCQAQAMAWVRASPPDLVVADLRRPVGAGTELVRRLRADPYTAHIPILATFADCDLARAVDITLPIPYSRDQVVSAVDALLREAGRMT